MLIVNSLISYKASDPEAGRAFCYKAADGKGSGRESRENSWPTLPTSSKHSSRLMPAYPPQCQKYLSFMNIYDSMFMNVVFACAGAKIANCSSIK
jgi:hypothetical protein